MTPEPPDDDQVAGDVQPALRAVSDVMEGGMFHVAATYPAARLIAVDHELAHVRGHQAQAFEFEFGIHDDHGTNGVQTFD